MIGDFTEMYKIVDLSVLQQYEFICLKLVCTHFCIIQHRVRENSISLPQSEASGGQRQGGRVCRLQLQNILLS